MEKKELTIELTESTYKKLMFLKENNYFKPMTENEVIEDLIRRDYEHYIESDKAFKEED